MERFERLIETHGIRAKLKDCWPEFEAFVADGHEHVALVEGTWGQGGPSVSGSVQPQDTKARHAEGRPCHLQADLRGYGHRALLAEKNEGVDWKAMMHALRVTREAEELLLHHTITYPRPEAELLLGIRKGELPYKQVAELLEEGLLRLEECQRLSTLPEKPDYAAADDLVDVALPRAGRSMTPDELRAIMTTNAWTQTDLARLLPLKSTRTIRYWLTGKRQIREVIARRIRDLRPE